MRLRYDPDADALYLRLDEAPVATSAEVRPGVVLDLDADGRVVGIELLDARRTLPTATLDQAELEGVAVVERVEG